MLLRKIMDNLEALLMMFFYLVQGGLVVWAWIMAIKLIVKNRRAGRRQNKSDRRS